ncbi:hypothetical protein N7463_003961 [Penicillium fimorum]|uniref:F-box domain-containing protein n=1 Tax=Penicillium fimorum TaxID=1882269 RepID=A0A9W9Y3M1_9EURO|nr:hypothetical protein N7463_003961 [Penicillium fimorum]
MGFKKNMLRFEEQLSDVDSEPDAESPILLRFPLLHLPSEIRLRIYHYVLFTPTRKSGLKPTGNVGSSAKKGKPLAPSSHRIALFRVSRQIHDEATHYFYSTQIFRVFPVQDFLRMPTIRALPRRHRSSITTIELIVGSSWTAPPKSWIVNQGLGLHDMELVRTLKVFVQCDPSHPTFEGFRKSKDFYTDFCGKLEEWTFDDSLAHGDPRCSKKVLWGPDRGWTDTQNDTHEKHDFNDVEAAFDDLRAYSSDVIEALSNSLQTVKLES